MSKRKAVVFTKTKVSTEHKDAIIRIVSAGVDTATVLKAYPEYTRQQVAAVKAHVTMGTY
ncbi:MAG: hypothetical protein M0Q13_07125 [Methanothrix sp.]|jgi:uncharacterized protein (DUF433 family)|nr:hypothetical protein [Methanothrix sp.]